MNYTNNCAFSVSRMTDSDLATLHEAILKEIDARNIRRALRREQWIDTRYAEYLNRYDTDCLVVGKRTIVATYDEYNGMRIGTAYPIHGDEFDAKTGIAVAYAKAIGIAIPDYI